MNKKQTYEDLEWFVFCDSFGHASHGEEIRKFNIFNHGGVARDLTKAARKYKNDRESFVKEVRHTLMYHYWSKCEWEVIISHWPPLEDEQKKKTDVYEQINMNWDRFIEYLWSKVDVLRKTKFE